MAEPGCGELVSEIRDILAQRLCGVIGAAHCLDRLGRTVRMLYEPGSDPDWTPAHRPTEAHANSPVGSSVSAAPGSNGETLDAR